MSDFSEKEGQIDVHGHTVDYSIVTPRLQKRRVIFLHGAGESSKDRCLPLARAMAKYGWESLTFSLPGHGKSSGSLAGSTLKSRHDHTKEIIEILGFSNAELVVGISMGAHTALALIDNKVIKPEHLVLVVPAIYAKEAEQVPFGPEFSSVLRKERSYLSSKALKHLDEYSGNVLLMTSRDDPVIPSEVVELIRKSALSKPKFVDIVVPNHGHQLTLWLADKPERLDAMARVITEFDEEHIKSHLLD